LQDLTSRARAILDQVDLIVAEDTRHSRHLLNHFGITTSLHSLHEHNERQVTEKLLVRVKNGTNIAIISDAGTPLISDPGYYFLQQAHVENITVVPIPGASAIISALSSYSRKFYLKDPNSFYAGQKEDASIQWFECDSAFGPYPYWNGINGNHGNAEFYIDLNRDSIPDFFLEGSNYSSSGGSVDHNIVLTPLRNNQVLICDHPEHENWIDALFFQDAIDDDYHWSNEKSILWKYSANIGGVNYNHGHYPNTIYYIGFYLADNDPPQYAWLKMDGSTTNLVESYKFAYGFHKRFFQFSIEFWRRMGHNKH
jgi:hypothetical protein